uniref:G-protein coupled receptors family 1 profile domain-containing protein n=1 Tax=Ditylenchus dipsaci TaxID=166011 RepID=A0A915DVB5_9BILA
MPYEVYVLALWRPKDENVLYYTPLIYWSAFAWMVQSLAPSIALLFITIERIILILNPIKYQERHRVLLLALFLLINIGFSAILVNALYPLQAFPSYSEGFRNIVYIYCKGIVGLCNCIFGALFLFLLYRYQTRNNMREARLSSLNNLMVVVAISIEFCINFVPYTVPFLLVYVFGPDVLSFMAFLRQLSPPYRL